MEDFDIMDIEMSLGDLKVLFDFLNSNEDTPQELGEVIRNIQDILEDYI
jgi:hypothetical protein